MIERVVQVKYAWITVGDIRVYVADLKDNFDETAILQQIYADGMGWC